MNLCGPGRLKIVGAVMGQRQMARSSGQKEVEDLCSRRVVPEKIEGIK
jgi:hypothetical protein